MTTSPSSDGGEKERLGAYEDGSALGSYHIVVKPANAHVEEPVKIHDYFFVNQVIRRIKQKAKMPTRNLLHPFVFLYQFLRQNCLHVSW